MSADDKLAVAETVYRYAVGIDNRDFALYLERRYRQVTRHPGTCLVYALREGGRSDV